MLIQQSPTHGGKHQSSCDLYHGKRNTKEFQERSSHQLHNREEERGADRDLARQVTINRRGGVTYQSEQYQGRSQRVNQRQQSAERKREKLRENGNASHGCNRIHPSETYGVKEQGLA